MLSKTDIDFEEVLKNIYDDKITIEKEKLKMDEELKNLTMLREKVEIETNSSKEKANKLLQNAKLEARDLLLNAKEEINEMIKEINKIKKDQNKIHTKPYYQMKLYLEILFL